MPQPLQLFGLMVIAGAVIGFIVALLPSLVVHGGTTFNLDQRLKAWVNVPQGLVLIIATIVMLASSLRVYWKEFFGAWLAVGVATRCLWQMGLRGQLGRRWARRLRSLYRYEPYRYAPYISPFDASILGAFQGDAKAFSQTNALVCAQVAHLAYESTRPVPDLSTYAGGPARALVFENHAGIVVGLPSAVIVAFRGTDEIRDWITNLAVWMKSPWPNWGRVHAGFLAAVEALWPQVRLAISDLCDRSQPVWFTGHSLGGAMAVLGAVKLSVELPTVLIGGVYTFGQPRVGDYVFSRAFATHASWPLVRIEACRDEVCDLPPNGLHVGELVFFDYRGVPHHNPGFFAKLRYQFMRDPLGGVGDHPMREYQRLIDGAFSVAEVSTRKTSQPQIPR